jgi:IS30 family transposase
MGKRYEHLSMEERDLIGQMHWQGMSKTMIAKATGRHKSTVSREIRRNASEQYKRYTPCQAQKRADERKKELTDEIIVKDVTEQNVEALCWVCISPDVAVDPDWIRGLKDKQKWAREMLAR